MRIDDIALVIDFDAGTGEGDDIGGGHQPVLLIFAQLGIIVVKPSVVDQRRHDLSDLAADDVFLAGISDGALACGFAADAGAGADGNEAGAHLRHDGVG
jgi:hypothetical protein